MGDVRPRYKRMSGDAPVMSGKLSALFDSALPEIPGLNAAEIRKARRVEQVRNMWRGLVDQVFLDHTNSVFVFTKDERREMHVYVDESIYAAELNSRRELIKWECLEKYGESIDDFHIHVSRGKYKAIYPFRESTGQIKGSVAQNDPVEVDMEKVDKACSKIADPRMRARFREAMISDLQRKKSGEC